jgi:DnaJ-class molecular chaperone
MQEAFGWSPADDSGEKWPYAEEPWEVLGIHEDATVEEINRAWKARSRQTHPDHGGKTEDQIKVNAARVIMLKWAGR